MKRGNDDTSDGVNDEQIPTEQEGSNDEQSAKNNAQAEDSSDSSKSSVKRMRSEDQEVRLLIPSKVSANSFEFMMKAIILFSNIYIFFPLHIGHYRGCSYWLVTCSILSVAQLKMAGAIIGKGGHNIQKLRTEV